MTSRLGKSKVRSRDFLEEGSTCDLPRLFKGGGLLRRKDVPSGLRKNKEALLPP